MKSSLISAIALLSFSITANAKLFVNAKNNFGYIVELNGTAAEELYKEMELATVKETKIGTIKTAFTADNMSGIECFKNIDIEVYSCTVSVSPVHDKSSSN